jgi:hypothetical protein
MEMPTWNLKLKSTKLISKNWPNDPHSGCESFAAESLDDFGVLEAYLLEEMEDFEDQLGDYVELDDSTNFDF